MVGGVPVLKSPTSLALLVRGEQADVLHPDSPLIRGARGVNQAPRRRADPDAQRAEEEVA
jgi:hypothetical protein